MGRKSLFSLLLFDLFDFAVKIPVFTVGIVHRKVEEVEKGFGRKSLFFLFFFSFFDLFDFAVKIPVFIRGEAKAAPRVLRRRRLPDRIGV